MRSVKLFAVSLFLISIFSGCSHSEGTLPYVLFKDKDGNVLSANSPISVDLNSTVRIYSEVAYDDYGINHLSYQWKIDGGSFKQYSMFDGLNIYSMGLFNGLSTQKATFDITFSDDIVDSGSTVTIRIKDLDSLSKEVVFKVK